MIEYVQLNFVVYGVHTGDFLKMQCVPHDQDLTYTNCKLWGRSGKIYFIKISNNRLADYIEAMNMVPA